MEEKRLVAEMRRLARRHPRYGQRRIHALLRREGWRVNKKRIGRLWREERLSGTLTGQLQTTWDTDSVTNVGSSVAVNAIGTNVQDISTGFGPMVRLNLASGASTLLIVSVYLTPKSE